MEIHSIGQERALVITRAPKIFITAIANIQQISESETETATKMSITKLIIIRFKFWIARNSRTIKAHLLIASDLLNENEK